MIVLLIDIVYSLASSSQILLVHFILIPVTTKAHLTFYSKRKETLFYSTQAKQIYFPLSLKTEVSNLSIAVEVSCGSF